MQFHETPCEHDRFIDENELSEWLGISVRTLRDWRSRLSKGSGPPWFKMGQSVRYRIADIEAYIERCRRPSAPSPEDLRHKTETDPVDDCRRELHSKGKKDDKREV